MSASFIKQLGLKYPLIQAPMAGVTTPALAAAVSNAGALGSLGLGASNPSGARKAIQETRSLTSKPFNVNFFVHVDPQPNPAQDSRWISAMEPELRRMGAEPPKELKTIYPSFASDSDMLQVVLEEKPAVVSFHFGLPPSETIRKLKEQGIILLATATSVDEAKVIEAAGVDAIVAQGWEAGGHRGIFDQNGPDERLSTLDLVRRLKEAVKVPLIATGGIMDGEDARAAIEAGAVAVQMGTAFVSCPESAADSEYKAALRNGKGTKMVDVISGRPARSLENNWTELQGKHDGNVAPYPNAYDLGKQVVAAAKESGEKGWGVQWSGTGYAKSREMPAGKLVETVAKEAGWV